MLSFLIDVLVDHCLDGDLWLAYIDFAEEHITSLAGLRSIFERALRNCPWIAPLWIRYAEYIESSKTVDHSQMKSIFNRALNSDPSNLISFVDLNLAYLHYRRRHYQDQLQGDRIDECETLKEEIRSACENACDQYQELFLSSADPKLFLKYNGQLELFWIHLEVKSFHSIDRARQIWNGRTLLSKSHNQLISNLWKNYYFTEIHYGDEKHARKVLYRALNHIQNIDYPLSICDLLLDHENKFGTIEQLKETKEKLRQVKKKLTPQEKPKREKPGNAAAAKKKPTPKAKEKPTKASHEQMETSKDLLSLRPIWKCLF